MKLLGMKKFREIFKYFVIIFSFSLIVLIIYRDIKIKIIKNRTKVALCAKTKRENRYMKYFIRHYKKLGYNHLYFGDNNLIDGESLLDVKEVRDGIKEGFITVTNRRGIKKKDLEWYYICYDNHSLEYDWISVFDIDEYLILEPKGTLIQEFLEHPRFNNCENIKINWRTYSDNEQLDFIDKDPIKRFPKVTKYKFENRHVKTIIRGKLNYTHMTKSYSPHSMYKNLIACSSSGKRIEGKLYYNYPPEMKTAALNHYVTKSIREFAIKKCRTLGDVETLSKGVKRFLFDYFFKINKKNKQKVGIFNEIFHTHFK